MRTSLPSGALHSGADAASQYLSFRQVVERSQRKEFGGLPGTVLRALLILYVRQLQGKPCRIADMFPGPQISDRTRLLCIRLMAQRGLLDRPQLSYHLQSDIQISDIASQALHKTLNIGLRAANDDCLDLVTF
jgi:hypothetical protein